MVDIDDTKRAKLEERLRLMMKKAESTTPEEAEMIMAQVEKLMLKLGIDDAVSFFHEKRSEDIITVEVAYEGVYAKAWVHMAFAIARALGDLECISAIVYAPKTYKKIGLKLIIMGHEGDANRAKILIDSLGLQCVTAVSRHMTWFNKYNFASASEKYNERRSFIVGFGRGAGERIKSTRTIVVEEATTASSSTALVLAERGSLVKAVFENTFSDRVQTRGMKIHAGGYEDGKIAGRKARTGETTIGNASRKAIG